MMHLRSGGLGNDIPAPLREYHILDKIGEGSFGQVYKGRKRFSSQVVALKFISKDRKSTKDLLSLRKEIEIHRNLRHENVILMLDAFETEREFCVVIEYGQGELFQILENDRKLPESEVRKIGKQLVHALHYLHSNNIVHRDLKPQNILIGARGTIKICDFGFARAMSSQTSVLTSVKGTPLYMAPELVKEQNYNHRADLWSLGVILYELAVGRPPFYTNNIFSLIELIVNRTVNYPDSLSPTFVHFLQGLLQKDPDRRLSWPQLLEHPFVVETAEEAQARAERMGAVPPFSRFDLVNAVPFTSSSIPSAVAPKAWTSPSKLTTIPEPPRLVNGLPKGERGVISGDIPKWPLWEKWFRIAKKKAWEIVEDGTFWPHVRRVISSDLLSPESREEIALAVNTINRTLKGLGSDEHTGLSSAQRNHFYVTCRELYGQFLEILASCLKVDPTSPRVLISLMKVLTTMQKMGLASSRTVSEPSSSSTPPPLNEGKPAATLKGVLEYGQDPSKKLQIRGIKWLIALVDFPISPKELFGQISAHGLASILCGYISSCDISLIDMDDFLYDREAIPPPCRLLTWAIKGLGHLVDPLGPVWDVNYPFPLIKAKAAEGDDGNALNGQASRSGTPAMETGTLESRLEEMFSLRLSSPRDMAQTLNRSAGWDVLFFLFQSFARYAVGLQTQSFEAEKDENAPNSVQAHVIKIILRCLHVSETTARKFMQSEGFSRAFRGWDDGKRITPNLAAAVALMKGRVPLLSVTSQSHILEIVSILIRRALLSGDEIMICLSHAAESVKNTNDIRICGAGAGIMTEVLGLILGEKKSIGWLNQASIGQILDLIITESMQESLSRLISIRFGEPSEIQARRYSATFGVRVRGIVDEAILLLLRLLNVIWVYGSLEKFYHWFFNNGLWPAITQQLASNGGAASPRALWNMLRIVKIIFSEDFQAPLELMLRSDKLIQSVCLLLRPAHISILYRWPEPLGGRKRALVVLVQTLAEIIELPIRREADERLLMEFQAIYLDCDIVGNFVRALQLDATDSASWFSVEEAELPIQVVTRLLLLSAERFGQQFLEAEGIRMMKELHLLHWQSPHNLLVNALSILCQVARTSPQAYRNIRDLDFKSELFSLLVHSEASVVAGKICHLVGLLCKHSAMFYEQLVEPMKDASEDPPVMKTLLDKIIECFWDGQPITRKFACFAIGNASFHNAFLYEQLEPAIPFLVSALADPDERTRSNAAGALGNLVRHSDVLCGALARERAPAQLLLLSLQDTAIRTQRIALFALGNLCVYQRCRESLSMVGPDWGERLQRLAQPVNDPECSRNIARLFHKLQQPAL